MHDAHRPSKRRTQVRAGARAGWPAQLSSYRARRWAAQAVVIVSARDSMANRDIPPGVTLQGWICLPSELLSGSVWRVVGWHSQLMHGLVAPAGGREGILLLFTWSNRVKRVTLYRICQKAHGEAETLPSSIDGFAYGQAAPAKADGSDAGIDI
ncbi:hypothetical protein VTN02DRAFT_6340 [Thermoascus thermophilus]